MTIRTELQHPDVVADDDSPLPFADCPSSSSPVPGAQRPVPPSPLPSTDILGVAIDAVDLPTTVEIVERVIAEGGREYLAVCAVHSIMEAENDPVFREILGGAVLRVPDGMPLVWLSRRAGQREVGRVRGADLVDALCARSAEQGHRHYFYGGGPGIAQEMVRRLKERHPGLRVAGKATPGRVEIGQGELPEVIEAINAARPDVLWVGLGCPKQEWWTYLHRSRLEVPVIIPVGAAFDFHSGAVKQAPLWMQRHGLEWVHRLSGDPARLFSRYLSGGSRLAWALAQSVRR